MNRITLMLCCCSCAALLVTVCLVATVETQAEVRAARAHNIVLSLTIPPPPTTPHYSAA
jgi:hypothetical protein